MSNPREKYSINVPLSDLEADPHPILHKLREENPVAWVPNMEMWLVTRWDDVAFVNSHPELFTAETQPSFLADALGVNMLTLEGAEAQRLKDASQPPFLAKGCAGDFMRQELDKVANDLIDQFESDKQVELMTAYAAPLSTIALQRVLGLDAPWESVWGWCQGVCAGIVNWEGDPELQKLADDAKAGLAAATQQKIDQVRQQKDHSAISYMAHSDAKLTDEEIINNVRLMISGGINEPRDGVGTAVWAAFQHPEAHAQVQANPRLWSKFINEMFRIYAPVGTSTRMTTQEVELNGVTIPAGDLVSAVLSSANRDRLKWENPDAFDLTRKGQNMAFATGQHKCLGTWMGFQTVVDGARILFDRLPNLKLNTDQPETNLHGFEFRGPPKLFLNWS